MLQCTKNKFWLENPLILFCNADIIPLPGMNSCLQMNAITRIVIIIFIILLLLNFKLKYGFLFLIISLLIIIILFYIQRSIMKRNNVEYFTQNTRKTPNLHKNPPLDNNLTVFATDCLYCNGECGQDISIEKNFNNPEYISRNQRLAGPANPKTKIAPVIAPPIADLGYWRANNLVTHSAVNKQTNVELYQSGYVVTENTPEIDLSERVIEPFNCLNSYITQNTNQATTTTQNTNQSTPYLKQTNTTTPQENKNSVDIMTTPVIENFIFNGEIIEPFSPSPAPPVPTPVTNGCVRAMVTKPEGGTSILNSQRGVICNDTDQSCKRETKLGSGIPSSERCYPLGTPGPAPTIDFQREISDTSRTVFPVNMDRPENLLNRSENLSNGTQILMNQPGWVNTACGYNPKQLINADLPTNLNSGLCTQDPILKNYNKEIFTQIIEPNVFTSNQINEPINSNIGISFTQQFPPMTCKKDGPNNQDLLFLQRDPRIVVNDPTEKELCPEDPINQSNIYDPRFTGYGTSYRGYIDDTTGQPRFYYDDIDAITKPNYIVRSKIDNQVFADKYGPIQAGNRNGNIFTPKIRALADAAFKEDAIQFRSDLQSRIARKINRKMWQRRAAPINTQTCGSGMYGL